MELTLTRYVDATPGSVADQLDHAVTAALSTMAADTTHTEATPAGLRIVDGPSALDGSEVRVGGTDRLTSVQVAVPWSDSDGDKLRLANRLAGEIVGALTDLPAAA